MTGLAPAIEAIRRRAAAVAEASDLEAGHPGATVRPVRRRDGSDGLAATVGRETVTGTAEEVTRWVESRVPAPTPGSRGT